MSPSPRSPTPSSLCSSFHPGWWGHNPHLQTLWGKLIRRLPPVHTRMERWDTPDGDFLDVYRIDAPTSNPNAPHVLILHGLEGGFHSHYARALLLEAQDRGWAADLLIWRSCGSTPNRARRFYHSGETTDLALAIDHLLHERPNVPLGLIGISLGGNVLLKYLGERGTTTPTGIVAAAAVSVPFDLARGSHSINTGFSRVYQRYFMRTLKRKAREKATRYPDLVTPERIETLRTLPDFDDVVTAPIHGFANASEYYEKSSALQFLSRISIDTILINAEDDPFLPSDVLNRVREVAQHNPHLHIDFPQHGGHVGFVGGSNPFRPVYYMEHRIGEFLATYF